MAARSQDERITTGSSGDYVPPGGWPPDDAPLRPVLQEAPTLAALWTDEDDEGPGYVDHVKRAERFKKRHPEVSFSYPQENGTGEFWASWLNVSGDPEQDGVGEKAHHVNLGCLLDYLEARWDRGDLKAVLPPASQPGDRPNGF